MPTTEPTSSAGTIETSIPPDASHSPIAELRQHKSTQRHERDLMGNGYRDDGLIFAKSDGSPIHPHSFSQAFERQVIAVGVPRIRLHDLRHTHATLLLQAGVPAKVSERLGHATVGFTMEVYAHVLPGMQADAAAAFADLVFDDPDIAPCDPGN
jgi:integrase